MTCYIYLFCFLEAASGFFFCFPRWQWRSIWSQKIATVVRNQFLNPLVFLSSWYCVQLNLFLLLLLKNEYDFFFFSRFAQKLLFVYIRPSKHISRLWTIWWQWNKTLHFTLYIYILRMIYFLTNRNWVIWSVYIFIIQNIGLSYCLFSFDFVSFFFSSADMSTHNLLVAVSILWSQCTYAHTKEKIHCRNSLSRVRK